MYLKFKGNYSEKEALNISRKFKLKAKTKIDNLFLKNPELQITFTPTIPDDEDLPYGLSVAPNPRRKKDDIVFLSTNGFHKDAKLKSVKSNVEKDHHTNNNRGRRGNNQADSTHTKPGPKIKLRNRPGPRSAKARNLKVKSSTAKKNSNNVTTFSNTTTTTTSTTTTIETTETTVKPTDQSKKPGTKGSKQALSAPSKKNNSSKSNNTNKLDLDDKEIINTNGVVDNTILCFLPEFRQRGYLDTLPLDALDLCKKFTIIIPDLELSNFNTPPHAQDDENLSRWKDLAL